MQEQVEVHVGGSVEPKDYCGCCRRRTEVGGNSLWAVGNTTAIQNCTNLRWQNLLSEALGAGHAMAEDILSTGQYRNMLRMRE